MFRCVPLIVLVCLTGAVQAASLSAKLTDMNGELLADAVIFAKPVNGALSATKPRGDVIDQVNKEFTPLVSVIQTGTAVTFPNKDNIRHHVYSFSAPKVFDLKLYSGVPASPVVFDKPGLVVLGCNIHDWMLAYVLVVDTPYFAKSGSSGIAQINNLPAGEYELRAWHPRLAASFPMVKATATDGAAPVGIRIPLGPNPAGVR